MKAVFWSARLEGGTVRDRELLFKSDESIPDPDGREVLVRVRACGMSDTDFEMLQELGGFHDQQRLPCGLQIAGVVTKVGPAVTMFTVGADVVGILPLDSLYTGCAEYCVTNEYDLVSKPAKVPYTDAASCIGEGLKMYTALRYLGHVCGGETVLIIDGAKPSGYVGVQLAQGWGAKVIATSSTEEQRQILENHKPEIAHVVDMSESKRFAILNECLEDTGGLGVDCIIDNGVNQFPNGPDDEKESVSLANRRLPQKHDIISALGVGGRWVTSQRDLQLDPPDSKLLQLKCASVCFLNEATWTLARNKQGKYLHILKDVMQRLDQGTLRPPPVISLKLDDISSKLTNAMLSGGCRKVIVEM